MTQRAGALLIATAVLIVACGGGGGTARPTMTSNATPSAGLPSPTATGRTPGPIGSPSSAPWPSGWDTAMCALFADAVVMQELAVDIGRTLDAGERDAARALTAELAATATSVREQLSDLPPWEEATPFERQMLNLLELADRMASRYERHFATNRRNALNAARRAGAEMNEVVPRVLARLDELASAGLSCPGVEFTLETPPEQ